MSSYRRRSRRQKRQTRSGAPQRPTIAYRRKPPLSPSTSLARLSRLAIHAVARKQNLKPRVAFTTTPQRTKSAPLSLPKRAKRTTAGSWREPVTLMQAKRALDQCARKARRRAVILAVSGGKGVRTRGPYKKHTEPCK